MPSSTCLLDPKGTELWSEFCSFLVVKFSSCCRGNSSDEFGVSPGEVLLSEAVVMDFVPLLLVSYKPASLTGSGKGLN